MSELKMPEINSVLIAGNLTRDPSLRRTLSGTPVANFFIASNRRFKDNTGQWREDACYVGVVAWYKLAESCYENLKKGSAVLIDGELQSRSLKSDGGSNRNVVEVKARRIQFLDKRALPKGEEAKLNTVELIDEMVTTATEVNFEGIVEECEVEEQESSQLDAGEKVEGKNKFDFGYKKLEL